MATDMRTLKTRLELAGVPTPLEQATAPKEWSVPEVIELRRERLCWRPTKPSNAFPGFQPAYTKRAPGSGLLERFVALAEAPDEAILRYARHWGVLAICRHGLPSSHDERCRPMRLPGQRGLVLWEPVPSWRFFSRHAHAVLEIAAATHRSHVVEDVAGQLFTLAPDPSGTGVRLRAARARPRAGRPLEAMLSVPLDRKTIWDHLVDEITESSTTGSQTTAAKVNALARQRAFVSFAVNRWLDWGRVRPQVDWTGLTPTIELTAGGLLTSDRLAGALALQLAYAVASAEGVATCFSCGRFYTPARRPAATRRSFCPECGLRAAWRTSKRAARGALKQDHT